MGVEPSRFSAGQRDHGSAGINTSAIFFMVISCPVTAPNATRT